MLANDVFDSPEQRFAPNHRDEVSARFFRPPVEILLVVAIGGGNVTIIAIVAGSGLRLVILVGVVGFRRVGRGWCRFDIR